MSILNFKSFMSFTGDSESDQYRILSALKEYKERFRKKRLYPSLAELIELAAVMDNLLQQKKGLSNQFPKHVIGFDFENKKIIVEDSENLNQNLESLFELIEWALPQLKIVIEEGIALFEFVENNITIDEVGLLPLYKDEGYLIIPDNVKEMLQIHRFSFTLFQGKNEKFRTLKTRLMETVAKRYLNTPESLKLLMVEQYKDMPNPATYYFETELDFPFNETLFPVAKRKLMMRIS